MLTTLSLSLQSSGLFTINLINQLRKHQPRGRWPGVRNGWKYELQISPPAPINVQQIKDFRNPLGFSKIECIYCPYTKLKLLMGAFDIKCVNCDSLLSSATMVKQSVTQSAKQALNWKVMLGLKQVEYTPTCEACNKTGKENFCCPKCDSTEIWTEDILKSGALIHKCK